MGKKDSVTIEYMRKNEIFADAFNFFLYGGEQVIHPENLKELDTREISIFNNGKKASIKSTQGTRDVIKSAIIKRNGKTIRLLLAIENQSNIHYAMPLRTILYDAIRYKKQAKEKIASHKSSDDYKKVNSDNFLSGFMKGDRIPGVITLVIYFGSEKWDGPLSIHDILTEQGEDELALIPDYKLNLIVPALIKDKDFDKFHSSLREVLLFIKYANTPKKFKKLLEADESLQQLGIDEINVLNACIGAKIRIKEGEEKISMCEAIQQMIDDAVQKAQKKAQKEVLKAQKETQKEVLKAQKETQKEVLKAQKAAQKEVLKAQKKAQKVIQKEVKKERVSTLLSNVKSLMEKMGLSLEQSMDVLSITESDRKKLEQLIN